jgi:zinc transporter
MTTTDLADTTPITGIVWAYRLRPNGKATAVPTGEVDAALADPGAGWVWVHLALADIRCHNWIAQHAPVSEPTRDVLAGPNTQLRLDSLGHEWLPHRMRAF